MAASSFDMSITNPNEYLKGIDGQRLKQLLAKSSNVDETGYRNIEYVEPAEVRQGQNEETPSAAADSKTVPDAKNVLDEINGKIQRLGDFVDTDAVSKCHQTLMGMSDESILTAGSCAVSGNMQEQRRVWQALSRIYQP